MFATRIVFCLFGLFPYLGTAVFKEGESATSATTDQQVGPVRLLSLHRVSMEGDKVYLRVRPFPWLRHLESGWQMGCITMSCCLHSGTERGEHAGWHTDWSPTGTSCPSLKEALRQVVLQGMFRRLPQWILSARSRAYVEKATAWENHFSAWYGPFYLECNEAFVLDHKDIYIGLQVPLLKRRNGSWHKDTVHIGYRACQGTEQVRSTGWQVSWAHTLPTDDCHQASHKDDIPF